jgi:hypothetical protein
MNDLRKQAVTGVTPPQLGEAWIREAYPSVTRFPAVASLGRTLIRSIVGAPLGWGVMLGFYFLKILPLGARKYMLTNRRLMMLHGWKQCSASHMAGEDWQPSQAVALAEIDDVRVVKDANSEFFRAGTLEILGKGKVLMTLPGVPEPESFRLAVLNACRAWVPGRAPGPFVPAKAP